MTRTFVLVHGAWTGGWVWNRVARQLEGAGHRVVAPTLPGLAPGDDPRAFKLSDASDFLVGEVERRDLSDVVLVAHDWSGYPVTAAAHRLQRRISKLVYWSAFVPAPGESLLDAIPADDTEALSGAAEAAGGDSVLIPVPRWENRFVQDAPQAVKELTYGLLRPTPWSYLTEALPAAEAAIADLPRSYLASAQDLSLPEGEEWWADKYAPRLGVDARVFDACHAAHLVMPEVVAEQLCLAASE
jgi:pimeloyl-ACP methyl ester carboxylesterase